MSLQVALTIDVEFTIGGAFADPLGKQPVGSESVECTIGEEGAGLGFILDTLEAHGLKGVFFVEFLNVCHFGDAPMGTIARRIHARGHDVQLHAHPCWTAFLHDDWQRRVTSATPGDSFAELEDAEIERILQMGLDVFSRWELPRPHAFRAGNLQADRRIYRLLEKYGIPLASNVGLGTYQPSEPELRLAGGRHWIDGTLEVPVSSYVDFRLPGIERWKTFTVIGTGAWEARQWLGRAARSEISPIVVLTHPSEYVLRQGQDYTRLRRNTVARRRLHDLCGFVAGRPREFDVVTFADSAAEWTAKPGTANPRWSASPLARVLRVVENRTGESSRAA